MNINPTLNFLLVDNHIQFIKFSPFSAGQKWSLEWVVSFADCVLETLEARTNATR